MTCHAFKLQIVFAFYQENRTGKKLRALLRRSNFIIYQNHKPMENQKDPLLNREDELKAENNLLKVKLGLEHGMKMSESGNLSADVENQWLKSVYAFEQQYKDAKSVKVYDHIGRPVFTRYDQLSAIELSGERQRLQSIMADNGVELDCICEYDDATIYRFITEELFEHEMDDIRIKGMTYHFIYEEFHPNHDYDLRRDATRFVRAIFGREWNVEYDGIMLNSRVMFSGKEYDRIGMASIIQTFQESHAFFRVKSVEITEVSFDTEAGKAEVRATLNVSSRVKHGAKVQYEGVCSFHFVREHDFWSVSNFHIPGFSRVE